MQRSDSAADNHSTSLAASATTYIETASTIKTEPRRQSTAAGTLPDWPCKLRGSVLWSISGVPFPACLPCRFWSAEIGLCSGQSQLEAGRFHRCKQWHRFNRQNRTSAPIPRRGDTPRRALQTMRRCALERLRSAFSCMRSLLILECSDRTLQQTTTARSWPLRPLQILAPLQPSKPNLDPNPPQRGHSPNGTANYAAVCSGSQCGNANARVLYPLTHCII